MNCEQAREWIGPYVDGEVSPAVRNSLDLHVCACPACAAEMAVFRRVTTRFAGPRDITAPSQLWGLIEHELDTAAIRGGVWNLRSGRGLGIAAALLLAVGLGIFAFPWGWRGGQQAKAATVDFGTLLDHLGFDAGAAFERFLGQYEAKEIPLRDASQYGRGLSFALPKVLPGGFRIKAVYALRFNHQPGVAARYSRDGELLGVIFHPPVLQEDFGTYADSECVVGRHRGHTVVVGEWSLVHLTDATTCHCVLSRLDESSELPAVMSAVAPNFQPSTAPHIHPTEPP